MPRLTYRAQMPDDPTFTTVAQYRFEHGKSIEVDDVTFDRLRDNPWFTGGREAKRQANEIATGGEGERLDSSVDLSMPPGSGSKYPGADLVSTGDGLVLAEDASLVDGANTTEDDAEDAPRRRGRPPKHG